MPKKITIAPNLHLYKWMSDNFVISPNNEKEYNFIDIIIDYMYWHKINVNRKCIITANTTLLELMSSDFGKYIKIVDKYHIFITGCRYLKEDRVIKDDEQIITINYIRS